MKILDATRAAHERAKIEGRKPRRWEMTAEIYRAMMHELGADRADCDVRPGERGLTHLGTPVAIVTGVHWDWQLIVDRDDFQGTPFGRTPGADNHRRASRN